jgi:hypothetical protein
MRGWRRVFILAGATCSVIEATRANVVDLKATDATARKLLREFKLARPSLYFAILGGSASWKFDGENSVWEMAVSASRALSEDLGWSIVRDTDRLWLRIAKIVGAATLAANYSNTTVFGHLVSAVAQETSTHAPTARECLILELSVGERALPAPGTDRAEIKRWERALAHRGWPASPGLKTVDLKRLIADFRMRARKSRVRQLDLL